MESLAIAVAGGPRTCLLERPQQPADDTALLINLASDAQTTLTVHPYSVAPLAFLAAGHAVASVDLPGHGASIDRFGPGLDGIAAALAAGVDPFAALRAHARAAVDACLTRGLGRPGRIFVSGTSRGGLAALHLLVEDDRIAGAALNAPVTHLPALREFAPLAATSLVAQRSAMALVAGIARRPLWIGINRDDPRVSTAHCRAFYDALQAAQAPGAASAMDIYEGEGHRLPDEGFRRGARWLLDKLA